jgi:hypothetical protein
MQLFIRPETLSSLYLFVVYQRLYSHLPPATFHACEPTV